MARAVFDLKVLLVLAFIFAVVSVAFADKKETEKENEKEKPHTKDDPHFVGAHGTRFDFNGVPGKDYCLFSDSQVHINMHMIGYYDTRTVGASVLDHGKAIRTWIGKLAVLFAGQDGQKHSIVLSAREGPQVERGAGFLSSAEFDNAPIPALEAGESKILPGGLTIAYTGPSKVGFFDADVYQVSVPGLFSISLTLRVAHPLLRTPEDAMTHINIVFNEMHPTASVHGVMGQTFRDDRGTKAMDYNLLGMLLRHPVAADGATGKGLLDGKTENYQTSNVYSADCAFSAYAK